MLADIRDYLRRRDTVNLRDLAVHFDMEPDAMRELLQGGGTVYSFGARSVLAEKLPGAIWK